MTAAIDLTMRAARARCGDSTAMAVAALAIAAVSAAGCSRSADAPGAEARSTGAAASAQAASGSGRVAPVTAEARAASTAPALGIAWNHASTDREIDAAFDAARQQGKPVFVYWGAVWCPPCNQVKATLFNRQDFIERSRAFVAVYVDGDSPGAQKIGARFHVSGYPTMVLFSPRGEEVTRLPGEVDPVRYNEVLTLGMNAARPVKAVLADALAGGRLGANDWRLLAFYSWDTDEQQLLAKDRLPATLARLAVACPPEQREAAMRLRLKALAAADARPDRAANGKRSAEPIPAEAEATRADAGSAVLALLADPSAAREQTDMLGNYAAEIVRALSARATPERSRLLAAFHGALKRLEADATLSRADRMQALVAQVDLARIDLPDDAAGTDAAPLPERAPSLPPALLADVREQAARADREISDGYERQAVITTAAYLLGRAGLGAESDALLKASLVKSHSPYYLMSALAGNARKRGDTAEALHWYRLAFEKSEGPATRLQWGASYVAALVDLAPGDEAAIEHAAAQLWNEAAGQPDAFFERSARSLKRVGSRLVAWNKGGAHAAALIRLGARLEALCAAGERSGEERATCRSALAATPKQTTS